MALPYKHSGEEWDMEEFTARPKLDEVDKELATALSTEQSTGEFVPETASERILAELIEADEDLAKKVGYGVKRSLKWAKEFDKAEKANNLPKGSLVAISAIESSGQPHIVGPETRYGRAAGLMQFIPDTARELGLRVDEPTYAESDPETGVSSPVSVDDRLDPAKAIAAAGKYFGALVKSSEGDLFQALMMYNWGSGNVQNWQADTGRKMPLETRRYLGKWKAAMKLQKKAEPEPVSPAL
jgi:soluble lytic murein transglycosylase-like protein